MNIMSISFNYMHHALHGVLRMMAMAVLLCLTLAASGQDIEYTSADSAKVVKLLKDATTQRGDAHPLFYFGQKLLGTPYVAHTLENGNKEHLIVNLRQLDCTTFVETITALALCDQQGKRTFSDYCRNLASLRYRHGKMTDYTSRLHYFTWWAEDNEQLGIVKDIAPQKAPWGPFTATQRININYMSAHPSAYKQLKNHPGYVPAIRKMEQDCNGKQYRYIPKSNLGWKQGSSLGMVHTGDIVAMLTDRDGLDTRHIGIAVWQNGLLHLMHASSLYGKVVISKETFFDYQKKQTKQTGIRVFRLLEHKR